MNDKSLFDAIGFGALNVDMIYIIEDRESLGIGHESILPGTEISPTDEDFERILAVLEKKGTLTARSGGGQAANTVVSLHRLGFKTGYIGNVGTDRHGDFLLQSLEGVDKTAVMRTGKSGICLSIKGSESDERTLIISPNANDEVKYEELNIEYLRKTRFIHMTSFAGERAFEAQKRVARESPEAVRITFDPGEIYARRQLKDLAPIIERSTVVFITDREIELLTGKASDQGSRVLMDFGPQILVCKKGRQGSKVYTSAGNEEFEIPGKQVRVVDSTGAGDVYAAGFLAGMLLEYSLPICGELATEMAAISLTGYGRQNYAGAEVLQHYAKLEHRNA